MASIVTVNQLIEKFKYFSDNHQQLKDFGYGPTSDIGVSRKMNFPYMWVTHRTPSQIVIQNKTQIPEMLLTFIIVDQINYQENYEDINGLDSDNQQEIISDCFQIAQDLVNFISKNLGVYGIKLVDESASIEPVFDDTDDRVTGWVVDLTLKLLHFNCTTPIDDNGIVTPPVIPGTPPPYLTCDTLSNCQLIQNIQNTLNVANLRLFSQTGDSVTIVNTDVETSIIDGGVGTLSVPANGFNIGDSFRVVLSGPISNLNNTDIRIRLKSGSVVLADSGVQSVTQHNNDIFKIETDFTIRNIGGAGTAEIVTVGTLQTTKKNSSNIIGFSYEDTNNTTFDTTIPNTLDITVEWSTASNSNSIKSKIFNLTKTY